MGCNDEVYKYMRGGMKNPAGFKGDMSSKSNIDEVGSITELLIDGDGISIPSESGEEREDDTMEVEAVVPCSELSVGTRRLLESELNRDIDDDDLIVMTTTKTGEVNPNKRMFLFQGPINPKGLLEKLENAEPKELHEVEMEFRAQVPNVPDEMVTHMMKAFKSMGKSD